MARLFGSSTVFELDVRQLEGLADKLSQLSGEQLQKMNIEVVNAVAQRAEITLRKYVLADVNIKGPYYDSKTGMRPAKPGSGVAEASVYALAGDRSDRRNRLAQFDPKQLVQAVKKPDRSKGDPLRGIAKGSREAGLTVQVMNGKTEFMPGAFLMPLKRGANAGSWDGPLGLFTRSKDGKTLMHRLGPAVYQVFRHARDAEFELISTDLEDSLLQQADEMIKEAMQ